MPASTRSAYDVSSTRSLNVPGSPSSALQTTKCSAPGALRQASHFCPVENPAPPRPRRFDVCISASRPSAPRASAAASARPGSGSVASMTSSRRTLSSTRKNSAGHADSGDAVADQLADRVDARLRQARDRPVVDQDRRALVAHSGARRRVDADEPVFGGLAPLDPELPAHVVEELAAAQHAVGDVVAEQHAVSSARLRVQERIEARDALDLGARQAHDLLDAVDRLGRDPVAGLLHLAQDLQQVMRVAAVPLEHRIDRGIDRRQHTVSQGFRRGDVTDAATATSALSTCCPVGKKAC